MIGGNITTETCCKEHGFIWCSTSSSCLKSGSITNE